MRYLGILLACIMVLIIAPFAGASSYNVIFNQVDNKVLAEYEINLNTSGKISIVLPSDARAISSSLNYSIESGKIIVEGKNLKISYISEDLLDKFDEGYYFVHELKLDNGFEKVSARVHLKEGYYLQKDKIFPKNYILQTDGEKIYVVWYLTDVQKGDSLPIFLTIKSEKGEGILDWAIIAVLIVIVVAGALYFYSRKPKIIVKAVRGAKKQKEKVENKLENVEKYLVESEKAVLDALKKADRGETWQKQLQIATGFSKAKLSRVIRNLEARNLIEKIPFGNTNKVRLK